MGNVKKFESQIEDMSNKKFYIVLRPGVYKHYYEAGEILDFLAANMEVTGAFVVKRSVDL